MQRWVCSRAGTSRSASTDDRTVHKRSVTRTNCLATFRILLERDKVWRVKDVVTEHNHELVPPNHSFLLKGNRKISASDGARINILQESGIKPQQIFEHLVNVSGGFSNVGFTERDLHNYIGAEQEKKERGGDAMAVIAYMTARAEEDAAFFYRFHLEEERLASLLWIDSKGRVDYQCFGDVIAFDSTYKTNVYNMPFVVIIGVNHHHQTCVFASALLTEETTDAYYWVLQKFTEGMGGKHPASVITDGARAMHAAIAEVWPRARHRLCSWHLERNCQTNIKNMDFLADFRTCLYEPMSIEQCDQKWVEAVTKHGLHGNAWIEATYSSRHSWAEAYLRGTFWGGMRTTQRCESLNALVKRFMQKGFRLYQFVEGLNKGIERIRHRETIAEYESRHKEPAIETVLRKIESHASKVFTRASFSKIRAQIRTEGLWYVVGRTEGTGFKQYTVRQYGDDTKVEHVIYKTQDPSIQCSCLEFETNGLPCCHAIHILKVEEQVEIPFNLIMNRWTKRARELYSHEGSSANDEEISVDWRTRYGALTNTCNQLCYWASQTTEAYNEVSGELTQLLAKVEGLSVMDDVSKGDGMNFETRIKDPLKQQRQTTATKRKKPPSGPRKCGNCRGTGHTKKTCPNICRNITSSNTLLMDKEEDGRCGEGEDGQDYKSFQEDGSSQRLDEGRYMNSSTHDLQRQYTDPLEAFSHNWYTLSISHAV